ncbi:right-handed parallel beta-helix repeat-containing protein [Ectothiorhodospira haloalkaliphila]|uniref:right-handed parallel beta-helix repeat-containing protein n=1 Tax=Ectothiorhodospira haloalkaliphila TaxID=421628 RepID=UPI001EE854A8|nr:right-handed parallel beta-helix repeat-containing protein [Ectothiorhodospira haloalkaliphila]MCG5524328.1 right-handed parallel beta-helix repeat-containing protein [Ectothiorhodospira haloalkaliphila]
MRPIYSRPRHPLALWFILALPAFPMPALGNTHTVHDDDSLQQAVVNAEPGDVIALLPGDYFPGSTTLRQDGEPNAPITLHAITPGSVSIWSRREPALKISGNHWHIEGIDFQGNRNSRHAVEIVGPSSHVKVKGNRFQNFDAALKATGDGSPRQYPSHTQVERNVFVNEHPRSTQTHLAAIHVSSGQHWTIQDNFIADIAPAPDNPGKLSTGITVSGDADGLTLTRNLIICEWNHTGGHRLGLIMEDNGSPRDAIHRGTHSARITNNIILNCPDEPGIYLRHANRPLIAHNTLYNTFGIQARYPGTRAEVTDNILSGTIWERDDGRADQRHNLQAGRFALASYLPVIKHRLNLDARPTPADAQEDGALKGGIRRLGAGTLDALAGTTMGRGDLLFERWFLEPATGNFFLKDGRQIIAQGSEPSLSDHDFCNQPRYGRADIGAIAYQSGHCDLLAQLQERHGTMITGLLQQPPPMPERPSSQVSEPDEGVSLPPPLRVLEANPDNYRDKVRQLQPGDRLELAPGEYPRQLRLHGIKGTPENPIVISGPEEGPPAVFVARGGENTISLANTAHVTLRHLKLDGRQQRVAGVVLEGDSHFAHGITLEHLDIRNYDGRQANSGITTRAAAWNWVIRHNHIEDVGTGMYLGGSDGHAPFIQGLIEYNTIINTLGYNTQIKHQKVRDRLPGMPTEPTQTIIRYNTFSKARNSNSGNQARPNLLVGHWPPEGPGQNDRYLIYGNLFHENPYERLFQGEGNVALYNNVFVNHSGDGLIVRPHNYLPRDIQILQNTVIAHGFGIKIERPDSQAQQVVAGNAVFANPPIDVPRQVRHRHNFTGTLEQAGEHLMAPYEWNREQINVRPLRDTLIQEHHLHAEFDLPHLDRDHTHQPRETPASGAHNVP